MSVINFKVGDFVRVVQITKGAPNQTLGKVGRVKTKSVSRDYYDVEVQDEPHCWCYVDEELELVMEPEVVETFTKEQILEAWNSNPGCLLDELGIEEPVRKVRYVIEQTLNPDDSLHEILSDKNLFFEYYWDDTTVISVEEVK